MSSATVKVVALTIAGLAALGSGATLALIATAPQKPVAAPEPVSTRTAAESVFTEPTLKDRVINAPTLAGALTELGTTFKSEQADGPDPASALLAGWCHQHLTWKILSELPETKRALVMKDPEAEIGKKLCWSGSIIEITTNRTTGFPIYGGELIDYNADVLSFYALGSSGDLVEHSPARICGIVTGSVAYSNSGGGVTHSVRVVGMFDLPANRAGYAPASVPR